MTDYKINRASTILLNEQIKHSLDKNLQDKTCTARKIMVLNVLQFARKAKYIVIDISKLLRKLVLFR